MQNERQPLYLQIKIFIQESIREGKYKENDRIPTETELMERFSVSRITVKNALTALANEGWIYRIPGRGSFVNDNLESVQQQQSYKQDLANTHTDFRTIRNPDEKRLIGLIIPGIDDYFAIGLIWGIQKILSANNIKFMISLTNGSKEQESEAIQDFISKGAQGLLIFPIDAEMYNEEILSLKMHGFPFVLIDRYFPGVETNFIASDGTLGAKMAISHLWELGHRNIAVCSNTPPSTVTVQERIQGYMNGLMEKGALINSAHILTDLHINIEQISEEDPLYRYIRSNMVTAYVALNGNLGIYINRVAQQIGLRVPEDISIITFDDPTPNFGNLSFFTHISQSEEEIGKKAAQILVDIIHNKSNVNPQTYKKIILEPKLEVHQSTGLLSSSKT